MLQRASSSNMGLPCLSLLCRPIPTTTRVPLKLCPPPGIPPTPICLCISTYLLSPSSRWALLRKRWLLLPARTPTQPPPQRLALITDLCALPHQDTGGFSQWWWPSPGLSPTQRMCQCCTHRDKYPDTRGPGSGLDGTCRSFGDLGPRVFLQSLSAE